MSQFRESRGESDTARFSAALGPASAWPGELMHGLRSTERCASSAAPASSDASGPTLRGANRGTIEQIMGAQESFKLSTASRAALSRHLGSVESELRELLRKFHIPELDAEDLLSESLVQSLLKSTSGNEFEIRVRATLEAACRAYWEGRRLSSPRGRNSRSRTLAPGRLLADSALDEGNFAGGDSLELASTPPTAVSERGRLRRLLGVMTRAREN